MCWQPGLVFQPVLQPRRRVEQPAMITLNSGIRQPV
jgi:hypothetical protein